MRKPIALCTGLLATTIVLVTSATASADELVTFDSARYLVGSLQQKLARERGEPIKPAPAETIQGYLSKPDGAGPFPAIVHLHGCGGLSANARKSAAERFTGWGYVTLVVDSFATRGVKETCTTALPDYRKADAFGALEYLSKLSFVDSKRVALIGHSQGAMATLQVATYYPFNTFELPTGLKYKAAVAFYPSCSAAGDQLAVPALVLIGALDDWVNPKECEWWMRRRDGKGAPAQLMVYPGAYHDFDIPSERDGRFYFGHWLKYDRPAAEQSERAIYAFLSKQLYN